MTLHKLSAGSGYEYLTRQVAAVDSTELGSSKLADYYSAKGEAPGRWAGSGLDGIDGISPGDVVTADQMGHLFGTGSDPITGEALGRAYRVYGSEGVDGFNAEVARRVEALGNPGSEEVAGVRSAVATEWFVRRHDREPGNSRELAAAVARYSRPRQTAVSGYDLTFSPVKSVSTLWALAPPEVARAIEFAHAAAVADAMRFLETHATFTREGTDGVRQVETRGLIAAAFNHRDSRAGDPDLHTHVAIANKVQTRGGKWLSIYGTVLHEHVVAASETYNTALEQHLREGLGLQFAARSVPGEKRPVREVVGVDADLNARWSQRRTEIVDRQRALTVDFTRAQGRPPTPAEAVALAQQANLATREAKHELRSEREQRAVWAAEAEAVLGGRDAVGRMVEASVGRAVVAPSAVSSEWVDEIALKVVAELESHRATWQTWHVQAEIQRQIRGVDVGSVNLREVAEAVLASVQAATLNLTPASDVMCEPPGLVRSDGTSVYRHTGANHFTSVGILDAEAQLRRAGQLTGAAGLDPLDVELAILVADSKGPHLNRGQRSMVLSMATDPHRLRVAIAPAGTGKTTAMTVLARTWESSGAQVVGLAPSAAAAAVLREATGVATETLAKLDQLAAGDASGIATHITHGTLVVIDEAGMADTPTLNRVVGFCLERGATVRLVGDDRQLAAVGAGGVLRDLAQTYGADRLDEVVRFADPVEAAASVDLRAGDPKALGFYLDHDRIHVGDSASCIEDTLAAWNQARRSGQDCLMLAPTRELVAQLNARARQERLQGRLVPEVSLRDGNAASVGDVILTRHNARALRTSGTDWVKNGDRWTVIAIADGSIRARHLHSGLTTVLPAGYVTEHVELGYASTVHAAQGITADAMHGILTGVEDRQLLYTMLSRGRLENHVHVVVDSATDEAEPMLPGLTEQFTATETLEGILDRDGAARSATAVATHAQAPGTQLHQCVRRYADAIEHATRAVLGSDAQDALDAAASRGPLPWLPGIPHNVAADPTWGPYLNAHSERISQLAGQIRASGSLPESLDWIPARTRDELVLWRAAHGVHDDDPTLLGRASKGAELNGYARHLQRQVHESVPPAVQRWESHVAQIVGHHDAHSVQLAHRLEQLRQQGHNPVQLLSQAVRAGALPDDRAVEALTYRIQQLLTRYPRATDPSLPRHGPQTGHGLGF